MKKPQIALLVPLAAALAFLACAGDSTGSGTGGASSGSDLVWYATCGDPACGGHQPQPGINLCTTEVVAEACTTKGAECDLNNYCSTHLVCTNVDPAVNCPISRRAQKRDIAYVSPDERRALADQLQAIRLAHYRYQQGPDRRHLGFIIDDDPKSPAVAASGQRVDLYGYTSLAVAAIQSQDERIQALEKELAAVRAELSELSTCSARPSP